MPSGLAMGMGLLIRILKAFALSRLLGTLVGISIVGISFVFSGIDLLGFRASFHAVEGKWPSST